MKRLPLLLLAFLAACGADRTAGTGSQTGNSVMAGRILASDSTPLAMEEVTLKPATWTADSSVSQVREVLTDKSGRFQFTDLPAGLWRVESRYRYSAWARNVRIRTGQDSTLPTAICLATGTLVTEVHLNDTLRYGTLAVLGTSISKSLYSAGGEVHLVVPELPPGTNWLVLRDKDGRPVRQASVFIHSGKMDTLRSVAFTGELTGPEPDDDNDGDD